MYCPHCNAELPVQNSAFCPYCGKSLQSSQPDNGNPYNSNPYAGNTTNSPVQDTPYQNRRTGPSQMEFQSVLKRLNTMTILVIAALVLSFIPYLNIIGYLLLLVILVMSLYLTGRTKRIFDLTDYPVYSKIVAGVKTKCVIILAAQIMLFVGGFCSAFVLTPGSGDYTGIIALVAVLLICSLVALVLEIYCFVRLFTVKNAVTQLSMGMDIPEKPAGGGIIIAAIVGVILLVGIAVVGIIAAIALPAYARYMATARYSEITAAADGVRIAVERCYQDTGSLDACSTGTNKQGNGWRLAERPEDYRTKYLARIEVKKGVITASAIQGNGLRGATIIYVPVPRGKTLDWQISRESTCKKHDLC